MVKRGKKTTYRLWIDPQVHAARKELPGIVRQRVKRILDGYGRWEFIGDHPISTKIYRNWFPNFESDCGVRRYAAFFMKIRNLYYLPGFLIE